jgi:hypothetical protein
VGFGQSQSYLTLTNNNKYIMFNHTQDNYWYPADRVPHIQAQDQDKEQDMLHVLPRVL